MKGIPIAIGKREKTMSKGFCPSIQSYFVHIEGIESIVKIHQCTKELTLEERVY